ncbi:MAG: hypothetical protein GXP29_00120 [Planctomycetes bacterium]|nr:hypothetical protein [Planctomycetota bacterium]
MAVNKNQSPPPQRSNWLVGFNVFLMVVLAVALVGGLQWIGLTRLGRVDLTSSGVNSLTEPTEQLLKGLDQKVRLTSLYFETDLENEDQDRYRSAVNDLLGLYRVSNRSKIEFEAINPLQDHDERSAIMKRLAKLSFYKEQFVGHEAVIATFQDELRDRASELLSRELTQLQSFGTLEGIELQLTGNVRQKFDTLGGDIGTTDQLIEDALASEVPAYGAATRVLSKTYSRVRKLLEDIKAVGPVVSQRAGEFSSPVSQFFVDAESRYGSIIDDIKAQEEAIANLPRLELDDILRDLEGPMANAILVETDEFARVIPFRKVWASTSQQMGGGGFKDRIFLGEQTITSAILQLTHNEKPAVVFVRHGGVPMVSRGNFMTREPPGTYAQMRAQLEDANFSVHEWDLATSDTPPKIDPPPSRTLFVVDRPAQSPEDPFQRGPRPAVFTPGKLEALKKAMGESPRALFLGGFIPLKTGTSAPNEYADYLETTWGIEARGERSLVFIEPTAPGKYRFIRNPFRMIDPDYGDHPIAKGLSGLRSTLQLVSPIGLSSKPPEGVSLQRIGWFERSNSVWSTLNVQRYFEQQRSEFVVTAEGDVTGEFVFAATAEKNGAKIAVISSADFATDQFAMSRQPVPTSRGISVVQINPGNAALFINTLHWLNDNTEWMNLGTPIDHSTLDIKKNASSTRAVQVFAMAIWPLMAALCGLGVYIARRR